MKHVNPVIAAIIALIIVEACLQEKDLYLRSLSLEIEDLSISDSINIDRYDLFQASEIVPVDDEWLLVSSKRNEYCLLFVNPVTDEHFFSVRKGRGPGEMLGGDSLHKSDSSAVFYCIKTATCIKIAMKESVLKRKIVCDTIGVFMDRPSKPIYMTSARNNRFVSCNLIDPDVWYSLYDERGNILSSVEALEFDELSDDRDDLISFHGSCKYVSHPYGTKVCVASVECASLSFAHIEENGLTEYERITMPPVGMVESRLRPDHVATFAGLAADDNYVYAIYSGNVLWGGKVPSDECSHLIVYSWAGVPVRRFHLDHTISSIHVSGRTLYGASTHPESCVYTFELPSI